ncbi:PAS domain S-box protein [Chryseotalea sanaruensis]|uniref:histidine kinase n=1 Tax=Chryseotalea sanaruensis TaxID=2482724 RepID=A0A401UEE2_9BACT|nr:PAS domain-containing sensor histidine kinase [Chryseotalea sanaruensis]GCC53263.1 PAS domain S-box protein [Chryseotalea sanaruensis]
MKISTLLFTICIGITVLLSLFALVGWIVDDLLLASFSTAYIPMAPMTATSFLLFSTAISLRYNSASKFRWFVLFIILVLFTLSVNVLLVIAHVPGFIIEDKLISNNTMFGLVPMGRMSPITALLFLLSTFSLFFLQSSKKYAGIISGIFSLLAFFITMVVLVGYLYNTPILYGDTTIPIALSTGLCFLLTSITLFMCNGYDQFPLLLFCGNKTYARLLRTFLPLTAFLILASGTFQTYVRNRYFSNEALIISIVVIIAMILVTFVTIYLSRIISAQIDKAESEKSRLRSIIEVTTDLVIIFNENGKPLYFNKAVYGIIGQHHRSIPDNLTMTSFFSKPSNDFIQNTALKLAKDQGYWKGESIIVSSTGKEFPVSHVILYHKANETEKAYYSSVMRDIRELKASQQKIEAINQQLIAKNMEMEEFVYALSHDLNEPLRMVSSFLQLTRMRLQDKLDEETTQYMDYASGGAKRMNTMIKDLLAFSRTGSVGMDFSICNIKTILDEALANLFPIIQENGASIRVPDNQPQLLGNASQLTRLFQNLIGNAIKYKSNEPPEIEITVKEFNDHYFFSVKDNGIGIESEHYRDIFKIFKRLHTSKDYNGSGIGLAVCKKIVEMHGGNIWVESAHGKGSNFHFTLKKNLVDFSIS